jgi:transcriptional regulator with XRE-family HTH domain
MQWNKDTLKEARTSAKLSQPALAEALGVHFRTVQNWEKGVTSIPTSVSLALDKIFSETQDFVSREEYNKVVEALNSATELNKKLSSIIQNSVQAAEERISK